MELSLQKQWQAKQRELLSLSKSIVQGNAPLATLENSITIAQTISQPNMRSAFKNHDDLCFSVVNVLVNRFLNSFAFTQKLDAQQIEIITVDTLEHFAYDSLEDVVLFFKMARTGKFGQAKKSVDSNLIYSDWFPKYMEFKAVEREKLKEQEKKHHTTTTVTKEDLMASYKKRDERIKHRKRVEYVDNLVLNMDRQVLEDTITSWEKDPRMVNLLKLLKLKRREIKK